MPRYARGTVVSVERSRSEIEECLRRYGASEFHSGWKADAAMIAFQLRELFIRFILPLPNQKEKRFTHKKDRYGFDKKMTEIQVLKEWEQEIRQRWRALLLVIKAKLEAVECGISKVEQEFLSFIVTNSGATIGEWILDDGRLAELTLNVPQHLLLSGPKNTAEIVDAEFEVKEKGTAK